MSNQQTYLVTGSMGCIGAWVLYHLVQQGKQVVSFDLNDNRHRINLLLSADEQHHIIFEQGDLRAFEQVRDVLQGHSITHVIHLAALQVPFCKADPIMGAQVNVVGTVNIFESAHQMGLKHIVYASSIAVYGPPNNYPSGLIQGNAPLDPHTLYGVYKQANEGTARVYWEDHQLSSTSLRPYTVYGVGRDQGLTSEPTKAMFAAASRHPYHISFGGTMQFQFASDVALYFIEAANQPLNGAYSFNLGTEPAEVQKIAEIIKQLRPQIEITVADTTLPFPAGFDDSELKKQLNPMPETPLEDGIRQTIEHFEKCLTDGQLHFRTD